MKGDIILVGVLDVEGSTNLFMAKSFLKAGYNVIPVNYRTIIEQYGFNTLNSVLYKLAEEKPAMMLFSKCNGIDSLIIGKCCQHTKTWFWFMDGMNTLNLVPECLQHAQLADYVSCTGLGVVNHIRKSIGGDKVHHIMEGIDPEIYRPMPSRGHDVDVGFIGSSNPERAHYLQLLVDNGYKVVPFGQGFGKEVHGYEFNTICSSFQSMLAMSVEHATIGYFSDRIFRYGACGSFVFHKYSPQMEKYFIPGVDVVYFDNDDSLLAMAKEYLGVENTEKRKVISANLRAKVLAKHTWDNTVAQILDIAEL